MGSGRRPCGPGKRSIEGSSEESRFLLNPFMLVAANPYSYNIWDPQKITDDDLSRADFPFTWLPQVVHWSADKSSAEVVYRVSSYNEQLYAWRDKLRVQKIMPKFALVAYNARDFGYQWIWVATDRSSNIECLQKPSHATRITQMLHCGGTCGYPGGCNNMSPSIPDIDEIAYTQLPAKACIYLWKEKPARCDANTGYDGDTVTQLAPSGRRLSDFLLLTMCQSLVCEMSLQLREISLLCRTHPSLQCGLFRGDIKVLPDRNPGKTLVLLTSQEVILINDWPLDLEVPREINQKTILAAITKKKAPCVGAFFFVFCN